MNDWKQLYPPSSHEARKFFRDGVSKLGHVSCRDLWHDDDQRPRPERHPPSPKQVEEGGREAGQTDSFSNLILRRRLTTTKTCKANK